MNSIFKKQFYLFTCTIVVCLGMMSFGIIQAFSTFSNKQVQNELDSWSKKVSETFNASVTATGALDTAKLENDMHVLDIYSDKSMIILDTTFNVFWVSDDVDSSVRNTKVEAKKLEKTLNGETVEYKKNFGDIYSNKMYTVCYPISLPEGRICAIACISSSMDEITMATRSCYQILVIFLLITVFIGFILAYFSSKSIAQPLLEMNEAAKVIANGDFEKRIRLDNDDEIGQLAHSFNEMASSLYLQEKSRREFLSNISHDLRSPLTSMRGFLTAILDGTIPEDKRERYLKIILDETDRLAKLANNMLEINRLEESVELNIKDFDINELATKTLSTFEERAEKQSISLVTEFCNESCMVSADEEKIQRVIYNLVDNALKFTHKYGIIKIITEISKDGKKIQVTVKDNGKGVSKDEQKKVFDRLYKVDASRGKDKKGTGLGLSIVREFIKAHNETISLKSEVGKGCAFTFTLSLSK